MLTFFRRIRKGLLGDGATSKYLIYVIGEIALVVIGILIALQINNWNEWRKDRVKEEKVLKDISKNLEMNKNLLSEQIGMLYSYTHSADIVISAIENKAEYVDSLDYHFHKAQINGYRFFLSNAVYEALKNAGFEIVSNDRLQKEVISLFEITYPKLSVALAWGEEGSMWKAKYMDEQFLRINVPGGSLKPFDYDFLINDNYYYSLINTYNAQRRFFNTNLNDCLEETQRVLQLIKEKLGETE